MNYYQPHPDAPPVPMRWLIEDDIVHPHTHIHRHTLLPNHAQFSVVTPPSDLVNNPDLDEWHWCIITWEVVEMPDPRTGEWYKFVKVAHCYRMTEEEIQRFKALVDFDNAVLEAVEARRIRIEAGKASEALAKGV